MFTFDTRPTSWHYRGKEYVNERPVAAQQTGWHFVAVMRRGLPNLVGGVSWYGVDDTSHGARIPVYCSATAVPASWTRSPVAGPTAAHSGPSAYWVVGTTDEFHFSIDSAWWVHNLVANLVYARWTAHAEVTAEIIEVEEQAMAAAARLEAAALALLRKGHDAAATRLLTEHTVRAGQALTARWRALWVRLTVRYRDGFVVSQNASKPNGDLASTVAAEVGYPEAWYARIAEDTEQHGGRLAAPQPAAASQRLYAQQLNVHECARAVCPLEIGTEIETAPAPELEPAAATATARLAAAGHDAAPRRARGTGAGPALSSGLLLAAVGCSLLVGAALGGGGVHWAARRRDARARAASSDRACADYRAF